MGLRTQFMFSFSPLSLIRLFLYFSFIAKFACQSVSLSVGRSVAKTISPSVSQSVSQSVRPSVIIHRFIHSFVRSFVRSFFRSVSQSVSQSVLVLECDNKTVIHSLFHYLLHFLFFSSNKLLFHYRFSPFFLSCILNIHRSHYWEHATTPYSCNGVFSDRSIFSLNVTRTQTPAGTSVSNHKHDLIFSILFCRHVHVRPPLFYLADADRS